MYEVCFVFSQAAGFSWEERKRKGKKEKEKDLRTDPGGILFFKDLKNRAER